MKNKIRICDRCRATNIKTLLPKLKEMNAEIEIGCQGFCGIGMTKAFAIVNNVPIIKDTEDELIESIKQVLK